MELCYDKVRYLDIGPGTSLPNAGELRWDSLDAQALPLIALSVKRSINLSIMQDISTQ